MDANSAEIFGLKAAAWLVSNEDLLPVFLGSSGLSEMDLKQNIGAPETLAAVLDFILMDDAWVMRMCEDMDVPNMQVLEARSALPGGEQVHWT